MTILLGICVYTLVAGISAYAMVLCGVGVKEVNGDCKMVEHRIVWTKVKEVDYFDVFCLALCWPAIILWAPILLGIRSGRKEAGLP